MENEMKFEGLKDNSSVCFLESDIKNKWNKFKLIDINYLKKKKTPKNCIDLVG